MGAKRGPKGPSKYTTEEIEKLADEFIEFVQHPGVFWLKSFALNHGVPAEYLSRWAAKNEKFNQALKRAKDHQEANIVYAAAHGEINPAFAIFTLKNVAGWRDQKDVKMSGQLSVSEILSQGDDKEPSEED